MNTVTETYQRVLDDHSEMNDWIAHTCQLVQRIYGFESVLVTLLDEDTQWMKYRCGIVGADSTPRGQAFCNYTVQNDGIFEVTDATKHPAFMNNPLVIAGPRIRYYAGAPLILDDGSRPGALCLIDNVPRAPLTLEQRGQLADFAMLISRELEVSAELARLRKACQ